MKKNIVLVILPLLTGLLMVSATMLAHHSDAEFDTAIGHLARFEATVTKFEMINPHILLHFEAKDAKGKLAEWVLYGDPPNRAARSGWNSRTFQPGERLTIYGSTSRYGRNVVLYGGIVRANGELVTGSGEDRGLKKYLQTFPNQKAEDVPLAAGSN
jgi:hypothetical protein